MDTCERALIVKLLKQDHDYLYSSKDDGGMVPPFQPPKAADLKTLRLDKAVKEKVALHAMPY